MYRWTHLSVLAIKTILHSSPLFTVSCQLPHISLTGPLGSSSSQYHKPRYSWAENHREFNEPEVAYQSEPDMKSLSAVHLVGGRM